MSQINQQHRMAALLRTLCERGLSDDEMICHDGGYRFSGDFMSMEDTVSARNIELSEAERRALLDAGFIEITGDETGRPVELRVTERGRQFAYLEFID